MSNSGTIRKRSRHEIVTDNILTSEERRAYTLHRKTPGHSQKEIAEIMKVDQSTVSRWINSAERKVKEIRSLFAAGGYDDSVVDRWLASSDDHAPCIT